MEVEDVLVVVVGKNAGENAGKNALVVLKVVDADLMFVSTLCDEELWSPSRLIGHCRRSYYSYKRRAGLERG